MGIPNATTYNSDNSHQLPGRNINVALSPLDVERRERPLPLSFKCQRAAVSPPQLPPSQKSIPED